MQNHSINRCILLICSFVHESPEKDKVNDLEISKNGCYVWCIPSYHLHITSKALCVIWKLLLLWSFVPVSKVWKEAPRQIIGARSLGLMSFCICSPVSGFSSTPGDIFFIGRLLIKWQKTEIMTSQWTPHMPQGECLRIKHCKRLHAFAPISLCSGEWKK